MIEPTCFVGALLSLLNFVFKAASFALRNKQDAEFVVPLTPGLALITLPVLSTEICTTTLPCSLQSYMGFGVNSAFLFPSR